MALGVQANARTQRELLCVAVEHYNKKARQCTIGQVIVPARPWGSRSRRLRDPQGLEGTITCPIVHWRAFFILFHHFRCLKLFVLLKVSRTISLPCAAVRRPCDGRPSHRINAPVNHRRLSAHGAHARARQHPKHPPKPANTRQQPQTHAERDEQTYLCV